MFFENVCYSLYSSQELAHNIYTKIHIFRASLVVQWLRICLPMQGTQIRSLVRKVSTRHGVTKSVPQLLGQCCGAHVPQQAMPPEWEAPVLHLETSPWSPQLEKVCAEQGRPSTTKNK